MRTHEVVNGMLLNVFREAREMGRLNLINEGTTT